MVRNGIKQRKKVKPKLYYHYLSKVLPYEIIIQICLYSNNLYTSIQYDNICDFKIILEYILSANIYFSFERECILHFCGKYDSIKILRYLIYKYLKQQKVLFSLKTLNYTNNIFHTCSLYNSINIVKYILNHDLDIKINVNDFNKDQEEPLFIALKHKNLKLDEILIKNGDSVNKLDNTNSNILMRLANLDIRNSSERNYKNITKRYLTEEITKLIFEYKPNIYLPDIHGNLFLTQFLYIYDNTYQELKTIVKKGYKSNIRDENGYTPLMICIIRDDLRNVKLLLKNGSDPNQKIFKKLTPLMLSQSEKMNQVLIRGGAIPNLKEKIFYKNINFSMLTLTGQSLTTKNIEIGKYKRHNINRKNLIFVVKIIICFIVFLIGVIFVTQYLNNMEINKNFIKEIERNLRKTVYTFRS